MDKATRNGIFVLIGIFLVFLTLKLCGVLAWSWWWICLPLWLPFALGILMMIFVTGAVWHELKKAKKAEKS